MSLILEALRKSEAERQRGRLPALATSAPPAPALRTSHASSWKWPLLGAAALALVLAAWLAGAGWMRRDGAQARSTPPAAPAGIAAASAPAAKRPAAAATTPTRSDPLPPIDRLTPPAAPAPARRDASAPSREVVRNDEAPAQPLAATATAADATTTARPAPVASDASRVPVTASATGTMPARAPTTVPAATPDTILSLADLDPATRKALPPLHVSMHLWDADPSRRFVILDGNRRAEGDRVGPAVVTAITRDGVLLEWNGRSIRVPLR